MFLPNQFLFSGRGKVVENYVKGDLKLISLVDSMKEYFQECNEFVLVAVEFGCVRYTF